MADETDNWPARPNRRGWPRFAWPAFLLVAAAVCAGALLRSNWPHDSAVAWQANLEAAQVQAAAENRRIFIAFSAPGCPSCRRMDREVFSRREAAEALKDFIPVRLDMSKHRQAARRFGVYGAPTFLVLSPQGGVVASTMGGLSLKRFQGFVNRASS